MLASPPSPSPTIWLDLLPSTVLSTIAAFLQLSDTAITSNSLSLAESTPILHLAVLEASAHTLCTWSPHHLARAAPLFAPSLRALHFDHNHRSHRDNLIPPEYYELLCAPTLCEATVADDPQAKAALIQHASVHTLTVNIYEDATASFLIDLLSALPLRSLTVHCYVQSAKFSLLHSLLADPDSDHSIPALCPRIQCVSISCVNDKTHAIFWRLFPRMTCLSTVRLDHAPRKAAMHQLAAIDTVHILSGVKDPVYHAERLGSCITIFRTYDILDDTDLAIVRNACPRMTQLEISLKPTHANLLLDVVRSLPELRLLHLDFARHQLYSGKRKRGGLYDALDDGMVKSVVESVPLLDDLRLRGLCIQQDELLDIIKGMGLRLKSLNLDLKGQPEPLFDRLEAVVDALATYCRNMESFDVMEVWCESAIKSNLRRKGKDLAKRRKQQRAQGSRLKEKMKALARRTRWGACRDLDSLVDILL